LGEQLQPVKGGKLLAFPPQVKVILWQANVLMFLSYAYIAVYKGDSTNIAMTY